MNEDTSLVDAVLQRVRATADPPLGSASRVLSGVERQLAGSTQGQHHEGNAPQRDLSPPALSPAALSPPLVTPQLRAWAPHVARLGRWVVFGLATGGVGYFWGSQRAATAPVQQVAPAAVQHGAAAPAEQRSAEPSVAPSPPAQSAPSQPDSIPPPMPDPARAEPNARGVGDAAERGAVAPARRRAATRPRERIELREALQLLTRAQSVLRRGWPERALELLGELEQRQPGELLLEERLVTRILALCELGEGDQAKALRQQLSPGPASSIYAGRLAASCVGVKHPTTD